MNRIDQLLANYKSHLQMPLRPGLPTAQRVWFALYPPEDERRLANRVLDFELATKDAGHPWVRVDLSGTLARWFDGVDEDERALWWKKADAIDLYARTEWKVLLTKLFREQVASAAAPERTVFALTGLMELYDFLHVSQLIDALEQSFTGFLLVFFPGVKEGNTYRFLDARPGWNYLAVPISSEK